MGEYRKTLCPIGEALPSLRELAKNDCHFIKAELRLKWRFIVGHSWARRARFIDVKNHHRQTCLYVAGEELHPLLARHEFFDLMRIINDFFGFDAIERVIVTHKENS